MGNKRPDGDGLVRKRDDGRWEGRIVVGHKEDGTPIPYEISQAPSLNTQTFHSKFASQ